MTADRMIEASSTIAYQVQGAAPKLAAFPLGATRMQRASIRRRTFVTFLGAGAAWPLAARAQRALPVIGFLGSAVPAQWTSRVRAFRQGLSEAGFEEGRNVTIEYRWAEGKNDRLPTLAAELVARGVDVIVVLGNTTSALAAKAATTTIPIVFRVAVNPVQLGLAASLNRPGGNLTGVTTLGVEIGPKQLELVREALPKATAAGLLINPTNVVLAEILMRELPAAARSVKLQLHVVNASADHDFDTAFAKLTELKAAAVVIGPDAFFNSRNELLAQLAIRHAMPAISPYREFAEAGGLMSYGGSIPDASRQAGVYAGRIIKGEKPADMPVHMAAKLELIVNLRTAKALGRTIPEAIVVRADEVIE